MRLLQVLSVASCACAAIVSTGLGVNTFVGAQPSTVTTTTYETTTPAVGASIAPARYLPFNTPILSSSLPMMSSSPMMMSSSPMMMSSSPMMMSSSPMMMSSSPMMMSSSPMMSSTIPLATRYSIPTYTANTIPTFPARTFPSYATSTIPSSTIYSSFPAPAFTPSVSSTVRYPTIATAPAVQYQFPSVATAPVVRYPAVSAAPIVRYPTVATAPAVQYQFPSVSAAPIVRYPTVAAAPIVSSTPVFAAAPIATRYATTVPLTTSQVVYSNTVDLSSPSLFTNSDFLPVTSLTFGGLPYPVEIGADASADVSLNAEDFGDSLPEFSGFANAGLPEDASADEDDTPVEINTSASFSISN